MVKKSSTPAKTKAKVIAPTMIEKLITDYRPDDHNANAGTERGLQMVEDSINEDGIGRSIVADRNGKIPAGNKTLEAAVNAGITKVIEVTTGGDTLLVHRREDWDLDDPTGAARRYAYRDNRASELGLSWDVNQIAADVAQGADLSHMFTDGELNFLLNPVITYGDEERGLNPDELLDVYMNATIKQVVLLFDDEQYKQVIEKLAAIRQIEQVETNTDAFLRMLTLYEKHISLQKVN